MMIRKEEKGSIMLETVLVLPIFVLIVFFLIQITFVWTAKQMTYYAAYCGARAALVYNPQDYHAEKQDDGSWQTNGFIRKGVVHHAACTVLSWISWSLGGYDLSQGHGLVFLEDKGINELLNFRIGNYAVPLSSNIRNQVAVKITEYEKITEEDQRNSSNQQNDEKAAIHEQFPAVTVSVTFKCPLFIPLGGPIIAYFFGTNDNVCIPTDGAISSAGFQATHGQLVHANMQLQGNYTESSGMEYYSIPLTETCTMAKPYKTDTYPLMPETDKKFMGILE